MKRGISNKVTVNRLLFLSVVLALYVVYFLNLGNMAFLGADEPRYARIGEEMLRTADFVTPTLNSRPWLEKPPLLFWMGALSFRLFGVSEEAARFPVALLGLLAALGCSYLLYRVQGRRAALLGLLILSTSPLFFVYSRAASTDMPLAALLTLSLICAFQAHTTGRLSLALFAGASLGLATLAKGPVALLLGFGVLLGFRVLRSRPFCSALQLTFGLLTLSVVTVPWFWLVWKANGYNFLATFILNHHLARYLTDLHHHAQPFWFFLPVVLLGSFPWVVFLGSTILRIWRRPASLFSENSGLLLYLWLWVLVPFLFFSFSESKLAGYILPAVPPLSMLVALEWDRLLSSELTARKMLRIELAFVSAAALLMGLTCLIGARIYYDSSWIGFLLGAPLLATGVLVHWPLRGYPLRTVFGILVGGMLVFVGIAYWQAAPEVSKFHSSKALMVEVRHRISRDEPIIFYRFFHHTALYYSGYQALPEPIENLESLNAYIRDHPQDRYLVLTQKDGFRELSAKLGVSHFRAEGNQFLLEVESPH